MDLEKYSVKRNLLISNRPDAQGQGFALTTQLYSFNCTKQAVEKKVC